MRLMNRRKGLTRAVKILGLVAFAFSAVPFLSGLLPGDKQRNDRRHTWEVVINLSDLAPGQIRQVRWAGGLVWVYHRRDADIRAIVQLASELKDPRSNYSRQPDAMKNPWRSINKKYFVFVPLENTRGCQVQFLDRNKDHTAAVNWSGGFIDPCEGARFDLAGRIYKKYGRSTQRNLRVPPYEFVSDHQIRLKAPDDLT